MCCFLLTVSVRTFFPPLYDPIANGHTLGLDSLRLRLKGRDFFGNIFLPTRRWLMFTITVGPGVVSQNVILYVDGIKVIDVEADLSALRGNGVRTGFSDRTGLLLSSY